MVVTGKTGGLRPPFPSDEDECRDAQGRLEKGLEGLLFLPFHLETISLGILTDPAQPNRLFAFSTDAAPVHKGEDSGRQAKVSGMKQCQMSKFKWSERIGWVAFNPVIPAKAGIQSIDS